MSRPLCSVVMATFDRWKYLWRSLECYRNQDFDNARFELVVIDDHSTDGTRENVLDWAKTSGIRTTVLTVAPKPGAWVDCGWVLNSGIRAAAGDHILLTHPEIMPGKRSVAECVAALQGFAAKEQAKPTSFEFGPETTVEDRLQTIKAAAPVFGLYACTPIYYLSPQDQDRIDTVDWKGAGAGAVREIEGFYTDDTNGQPDYRHLVADRIGTPGYPATWESFVLSGHSRETWRKLGGHLVSHRWGSTDVAWVARRRAIGIPNHTCTGPECIAVHQHHGGTERDEKGWRDELAPINWEDRAKLVWPYQDHLGW